MSFESENRYPNMTTKALYEMLNYYLEKNAHCREVIKDVEFLLSLGKATVEEINKELNLRKRYKA
jgi:hypothetical protein